MSPDSKTDHASLLEGLQAFLQETTGLADDAPERLQAAQQLRRRLLARAFADSGLAEHYEVLVLVGDARLTRAHVCALRAQAWGTDPRKPLLLVLETHGGDVDVAPAIVAIGRERSLVGFEVAVPRHAYSAGTLIVCGADRVHLGADAELGPIDTQLGDDGPALDACALVRLAARESAARPQASAFLVELLQGGGFELPKLARAVRAVESTQWRAEQLLGGRRRRAGLRVRGRRTDAEVARWLGERYFDHEQTITSEEARQLLGEDVVTIEDDVVRRAARIAVACRGSALALELVGAPGQCIARLAEGSADLLPPPPASYPMEPARIGGDVAPSSAVPRATS